MALGTALIEKLQLLARLGPAAVGAAATPVGWALAVGEYVTVQLHDYDRYSVALQSLVVGAPRPGDEPLALLEHTAERIARALQFLEEPLALVERDGDEGQAQLRSNPPQVEEDTGVTTYWEVVLRLDGGLSAMLARYRWAPGMPERELVEYPAAFALLGRMATALDSALHAE